MLSRLYWDEEIDKIGHIDKTGLYSRLLTSYDWCTLFKLVPAINQKNVPTSAIAASPMSTQTSNNPRVLTYIHKYNTPSMEYLVLQGA